MSIALYVRRMHVFWPGKPSTHHPYPLWVKAKTVVNHLPIFYKSVSFLFDALPLE